MTDRLSDERVRLTIADRAVEWFALRTELDTAAIPYLLDDPDTATAEERKMWEQHEALVGREQRAFRAFRAAIAELKGGAHAD